MTYVDESQGMNSNGRRTVSAFFDDRDDALDAVEQLRGLGIAGADIRLTSGAGASGQEQAQEQESQGFFEMLGELFFPSDDREAYAEGLQRGGHLVTVTGVSDADYDEVVDILDNEGAVDMDERTANWRSEGWRGRDGITGTLDDTSGITGFDEEGTARRGMGAAGGVGGMATGMGMGQRTGSSLDDPSDMGISGTGTRAVGMGGAIGSDDVTSMDSTGMDSENETLQVVEERLRVGKRDASRGGVRVRSYVVEEPVSETVTLHAERVDVERRAVDRRVTDADNAFRERTIEAEEYGEEAVVDKEARVVEEIGLRKTGTSREETISDTLRRTEVEVEDDRDDSLGGGTSSGSRSSGL